jgi:hypothetical protein
MENNYKPVDGLIKTLDVLKDLLTFNTGVSVVPGWKARFRLDIVDDFVCGDS